MFTPEKDKCKKCSGAKTVKEKKTLDVFVAKGTLDGQKITFQGEADEAPDVTPGDVVVVVQVKEHPVFRRNGSHLHMKKSITLLEALTGFQFTITHLDDRTLVVKSVPSTIVKPGDWKLIKDEGMPNQKNPYLRGNLYIEFDVVFPDPSVLTPQKRQALLSVLPGPAASEKMDQSSDTTEEAILVDVDIAAEKRRFAEENTEHERDRREAYDDDDDHSRGGQQAQCRTQ